MVHMKKKTNLKNPEISPLLLLVYVSLCVYMCIHICVLGQLIASAVEAVFLKVFCSVLGKTLKSSCTDPYRDEERHFPPLFHKIKHGSGTLRTGGDLGASWDGPCLPGGGRKSSKISVFPLFLKFHD